MLLLATLVAFPAWSQIYKWVDDDGVVNYSSSPPSNRKSEELDLNSVTVSVIETAKTDQRTAWAVKSEVSGLRQKVEQLERQLEAERYARQYTTESEAMLREPEYGYPGTLYSPTAVVFVRPHLRRHLLIRTLPIQTPLAPKRSFPGMRHPRLPG